MKRGDKKKKNQFISKSKNHYIAKILNENISKIEFNKINPKINFEVYTDFFRKYRGYEEGYLKYYSKWIRYLRKHIRLITMFITIEREFPYSGWIFIIACIMVSSLKLKETYKRRLNAIFIGKSGVGKDIITIFPEKIRDENTVIKKFDSTTIKGLQVRLETEKDLFDNKAHVYSDLTSLQTLARQPRTAWFNYYNSRLDKDFFDDSSYYSKPSMNELKKGVVILLATCTKKYLHTLKYNYKEGLTESTFWDRVIFVDVSLTQKEIDMGDAFTSFQEVEKAVSQVDIKRIFKDILLGKKQYEVILPKEFIPYIMQLRNCLYLSKDFIHEFSSNKKKGKSKSEKKNKSEEKIVIISTTETRRSKEQVVRILKCIALLRGDKLRNTEVNKIDIELCKKLFEFIFIKPNKFWKIYYYMLSYSNPVTKKTFLECEDSFFKLSNAAVTEAFDYLEKIGFIKSRTKEDSSHQKVYYLNEYKGDENGNNT